MSLDEKKPTQDQDFGDKRVAMYFVGKDVRMYGVLPIEIEGALYDMSNTREMPTVSMGPAGRESGWCPASCAKICRIAGTSVQVPVHSNTV